MKRCDALAERGYCERPLPCEIHNRRIYDLHQAGMLTDEQAVRLCVVEPPQMKGTDR